MINEEDILVRGVVFVARFGWGIHLEIIYTMFGPDLRYFFRFPCHPDRFQSFPSFLKNKSKKTIYNSLNSSSSLLPHGDIHMYPIFARKTAWHLCSAVCSKACSNKTGEKSIFLFINKSGLSKTVTGTNYYAPPKVSNVKMYSSLQGSPSFEYPEATKATKANQMLKCEIFWNFRFSDFNLHGNRRRN